MNIFVIVAWLHLLSAPGAKDTTMEVQSMELGGVVKEARVCGEMNNRLPEILKDLPDASKQLADGYIPAVICGVAAPPASVTPKTSEPKTEDPAPPVRSEPGHPDQPKKPSAVI
jgi:hypothetical protein